MKKTCNKCNIEKLVEEFAFRNKSKGTRQSLCRNCMSDRCSKLYKTSTTRKNKIKTRNKNVINYFIEVVRRYKERYGCKKCGNKYPHYVLDFHHLENKDAHVSELVRKGNRNKIKKEIKKCEVLCSNCHRTEHWNTGTAGKKL